ncbi:phosphodiesterase [Xylophilus rhododendri]|uniref:Phosphodiesterase n=1 Tax=Xylophilus rhododendri TaxID=2697032 RepID=A0A857JC06_9BURK|nr:HD domain-containing phosphohydrolase [Xylophilus rhododendri]QHJ00712.1 phosphodiesterase [Xylophilus rhododendri]
MPHSPHPTAVPLSHEQGGEDLLGLWSDLESGLSMVLAHPQAVHEFPRKILQYDLWMQALVRADADTALYLLFQLASTSSVGYSASHALVCATLCHVLAQEMRLHPAGRDALVRAAMTMNIAMTQLQDELALQTERLSPGQRQIVDRHPDDSALLLRRLGVDDGLWLELVGHHHIEGGSARLPAWNTLAQPMQLPHILATIDRYAAMISPRASRSGRTASDSYGALVDGRSNPYVAVIGQALLRAIGRFPPGSFVLLESGETAVVVQNGRQAQTPAVAVLRDGAGTVLKQPRLTAQAGHIRQSLSHEQAALPHGYLRLLQIGVRARKVFKG